MPEMYTGFIAVGPTIIKGGHIVSISEPDIAVLIAKLLNIDFKTPDGKPVAGIISTKKKLELTTMNIINTPRALQLTACSCANPAGTANPRANFTEVLVLTANAKKEQKVWKIEKVNA